MKCRPYRQPGRKSGRNGQEPLVCCTCCARDNGVITIEIRTSVSHDMLSSRKTWVDGKCRCNDVGWALGPFVIIFPPAPSTPVSTGISCPPEIAACQETRFSQSRFGSRVVLIWITVGMIFIRNRTLENIKPSTYPTG